MCPPVRRAGRSRRRQSELDLIEDTGIGFATASGQERLARPGSADPPESPGRVPESPNTTTTTTNTLPVSK